MAKKIGAILESSLKKSQRRKFWKTFLLLLIVAMLALVIIFFVSNTISFLTKEELSISLKPKETLILANYDEVKKINISFTNENFAWCQSKCDYTYKDLSNELILDKGSKVLEHKQTVDLSYNISSDFVGKGQKIFSFEVQCNNIKSAVCRTNQNRVVESSLITLEFDQSEEEKKLSNEINDRLHKDIKKLSEIDVFNRENEAFLQVVDKNFLNSVRQKQNKISDALEKFNQKIMLYHDLWNNRSYKELIKKYEGYDFDDNSIFALRDEIFDSVDFYNDLVNRSHQTLSNQLLNEIQHFIEIKSDYNQFKEIYGTLDSFESLENVGALVNNFNEKVLLTNYTYAANKKIIALQIILEKYKFLLDPTTEVNISYDDNVVYSKENNNLCLQKDELIKELELHNSLINSSTDLKSEVEQLYYNKLHEILDNKTKSLILIPNSVNMSVNLTPYKINFEELILLTCNKVESFNFVENITLKDEIVKKIGVVESKVNMTLAKHKTQCCVFGDCRECCYEGCDVPFPVLLLHGHSFHQDDKVEASLKTLSKMQKKLEEDGFINAGEIDISDEFTNRAYLGRINVPVSIRSTYYLINTFDLGPYKISTQKTDRIENYAIRLREIIDLIKFKTGSEKVHIVAHSMGGLVAREYINLFGEKNIGKIVMISVPNTGLDKNVVNLCKVTGADSECEDMAKGGVFLKRLNALQTSIDVPILNILGQGCKNGGDGVLRKEDGYLEFAKNVYVNGTCSDYFETEMHLKMIDPKEYEEVYDLVLNFLK